MTVLPGICYFSLMNRVIPFLLFMSFFIVPVPLMAMDMSGYRPAPPFGVLSTASADTPEKMQSAVAFSVEKVGNPDYYRYSTQLAMGVTRNIEFGINFPYVEEENDEGVEDITFSVKHRFFEEGRYGPSAAYILLASKASNNESYSTGGAYGGGLVASKRIGPLQVHINMIYTAPEDEAFEDEIRSSLGFVFAADHNFSLLAEIIARKSYESNSVDKTEARMGYRFLYGNRIYSTLAFGLGLDDAGPDYRIVLSISLLFPKKQIAVEDLN